VEDLVVVQREMLDNEGRWVLTSQISEHALSVWVDRSRIEQVISNLLDNAMKYSPEGGLITVGTQRQGDSAQISITDPGIGIPEQDLSQLFTPFFRASNASSRHFPGVGLGLYLCRSILYAHGGTISVTSREGQGTTFLLSLPYESQEQRQEERNEKPHTGN
jgi:signal transduction histidine kinase